MFTIDTTGIKPPSNTTPVGAQSSVTSIDLARNEKGAARKLAYSFPDGRARYLTLDLVGTGRFLDYYDDKRYDGKERFGEKSDPKSGRPDCGWAETSASKTRRIWAPCTFRPAPADVRRIMPWFETSSEAIEEGFNKSKPLELAFSRRCWLRVELGPDGYSTGADERLALVFQKPPALIAQYADGAYSNFAGAVTRWGSDPLAETPVPTEHLDRSFFVAPKDAWGIGLSERTFRLPAGADGTGGTGEAESIEVELYGYPIKFCEETGTFYADIAIKPGKLTRSYMPFVQLGLARFQPHAVEGQQLSHARGHVVQLLPDRTGSVLLNRNASRWRVQMDGPVAAHRRHELDVSVFRRADGSNGKDAYHWLPAGFDGQLEQVHTFKMTETLRWDTGDKKIKFNEAKRLGLLIEEYEVIPQKEAGSESPKESRRLIFGHMVDIG
jgi:hypothetical protein